MSSLVEHDPEQGSSGGRWLVQLLGSLIFVSHRLPVNASGHLQQQIIAKLKESYTCQFSDGKFQLSIVRHARVGHS